MQEDDHNNQDERPTNHDKTEPHRGRRQLDLDSGGEALPNSGGSYCIGDPDDRLQYDFYMSLSRFLNGDDQQDFNKEK